MPPERGTDNRNRKNRVGKGKKTENISVLAVF